MVLEEVKNILEHEAQAIKNIPASEDFPNAVDLIHKYVHEKGGKLITSGMGKAGQIAINMATTFSSTGTPSCFLHPSEAQHGDLGVVQENDVLLMISNSGKTREIIELIDLARGLRPNIPIVVITSNTDSVLAKEADVCINTGNPKEVCSLGLTPTTSTTTMTVIGDVLVVLLMKKINFSNTDYSKRHHGGYLGHKSREAAGLNK
ncbi:SIS domain-containing protein [Carboxylicivirga sp. M1479]|uniref:SIS domain-containing protein n=1 Tax=Carboxylicivirga sp. M1479 TaxID=2594476 RepID=UPI001178C5C3|nr:SIS domain-containing protein [Carboxylicivirga sp. M1479]TRX63184.1 SIS domain-containing protein [Carboxylicivirga sp. M1479]